MSKQKGAIVPLVLIIIIIILAVLAFIFISQNKFNQTNESKSPQTAAGSSYLKEQYQNPFEEKSQYENPFSEDSYQNPFDNLK